MSGAIVIMAELVLVFPEILEGPRGRNLVPIIHKKDIFQIMNKRSIIGILRE